MPRVLRPGLPLADRINETVGGVLDPARIARLHALGGWLRIEEGMTLFHFAYRPARPGRVVEVGTFLGKSTAWMATALQRAGAADRIVAIDPHQRLQAIEDVYDVRELQDQAQMVAASTGVPSEDVTTRELFLDNMASLGLSPFVEPVVATSAQAAEGWDQPIRLLFIDGSHLYEDAMADLRTWEPHVVRGGIICMHDTRLISRWRGARRAMKEYLMADDRFRHLLHTGNLTAFEKLAPACTREASRLEPELRLGERKPARSAQ